VYVANRTGVLAAIAAAIASTETSIGHVGITVGRRLAHHRRSRPRGAGERGGGRR